MKSVVVEIRPFLDPREVLAMLNARKNEQCFRLEFIRISMALDVVRSSFEGLWRVCENGSMERAIGSVPRQLWTIDVTLASNLGSLLALRSRKYTERMITLGLSREDEKGLPSGRIMVDLVRFAILFPCLRFRFFGPLPTEELHNLGRLLENMPEKVS